MEGQWYSIHHPPKRVLPSDSSQAKTYNCINYKGVCHTKAAILCLELATCDARENPGQEQEQEREEKEVQEEEEVKNQKMR